jgi:hypothetical protein
VGPGFLIESGSLTELTFNYTLNSVEITIGSVEYREKVLSMNDISYLGAKNPRQKAVLWY